ncbi:ABC transporter permease [Salaquimonas pukyongi]|uniref:ABC transporter permease n=1 Tax=Salaquimonas pukyongi TaxID=2712698 RepID=UPI0009F9077D|nr:ABC transporter permease subunit [Salaquimonas pukyongi]
MWDSLQLLAFSPPGWGGVLLRGLVFTLIVALGAYALGLVIGFLGAVGKIYGGPILKTLLETYTTLIRAVPELVLILLLYFAGEAAINLALTAVGLPTISINPILAGILVLGFVQGAYTTEVIRAAMLAVPKGQVEAAYAYGMSRTKMLARIMIPSMIPFALPGLANLWLIVTKDTALLAVIGSVELATVTRQAAGSTRSYLLFYSAAAVLYLCLTLVSTWIFRRLERRYRPESGDALKLNALAIGRR